MELRRILTTDPRQFSLWPFLNNSATFGLENESVTEGTQDGKKKKKNAEGREGREGSQVEENREEIEMGEQKRKGRK